MDSAKQQMFATSYLCCYKSFTYVSWQAADVKHQNTQTHVLKLSASLWRTYDGQCMMTQQFYSTNIEHFINKLIYFTQISLFSVHCQIYRWIPKTFLYSCIVIVQKTERFCNNYNILLHDLYFRPKKNLHDHRLKCLPIENAISIMKSTRYFESIWKYFRSTWFHVKRFCASP